MMAGRRARARARDKVTFRVEGRHPGTPSKRPATAGRSQLCPAELSASSPSHLRASLPAAPPPPPPPSQPLRLRGTVPGAPGAASASALPAARQPPLSHARASALPPQRQRGELGVTGLWPPGADRTGTEPQGADARRRGKGVRISAGTGACPRHANTLALTSSLRLRSPPETVLRSASPRRQGPQPAKGQLLPGRGVRSRPARDLSPPASRCPGVPTAAHLALAWREGRGPGGGPRLRRGSSPHPQSGSQRCAPLARAALLRGASAAGGWRLSGRRADRALSSPGRSEAAATAAGGGFLRCCPSRFPRISAVGTPAPPPQPRLWVSCSLRAREWF